MGDVNISFSEHTRKFSLADNPITVLRPNAFFEMWFLETVILPFDSIKHWSCHAFPTAILYNSVKGLFPEPCHDAPAPTPTPIASPSDWCGRGCRWFCASGVCNFWGTLLLEKEKEAGQTVTPTPLVGILTGSRQQTSISRIKCPHQRPCCILLLLSRNSMLAPLC